MVYTEERTKCASLVVFDRINDLQALEPAESTVMSAELCIVLNGKRGQVGIRYLISGDLGFFCNMLEDRNMALRRVDHHYIGLRNIFIHHGERVLQGKWFFQHCPAGRNPKKPKICREGYAELNAFFEHFIQPLAGVWVEGGS